MAEMNVVSAAKGPALEARLPTLSGFGSMMRRYKFNWPPTSDELVVPTDLFRVLLRFALEHVQFDEQYYLTSYPDVVQAVKQGLFSGAHHHYLEFGYLEGRLPFPIEVDEAFYFWAYPDVKAEVLAGSFSSAQEHFELCGYKEGREPREGWSLLAS